VMDALGAQIIFGRTAGSGDAYDWTKELERNNFRWEKWNKEAQAQLINEIWTDGVLIKNGVAGTPFMIQLTDSSGSPRFDASGNPILNMDGGKFYELPECIEKNDGTCDVQFIAMVATVTHASRDGVDHTRLAKKSVQTMQRTLNVRASGMFNMF